MSNVIDIEAFRRAIFRGSRDNPVYHPDDLPRSNSRYTPDQIDRWIEGQRRAKFRQSTPPDDGDAA